MKKLNHLRLGILAISLVASATCYAQSGLMETLVVPFNGTNGSDPVGELIQGNDGLLYGATTAGGDFGQGTIFKTTLDGSLTTLFSFNGTNGSSPIMPLHRTADGTSYGINLYGGNGFDGTYGSGLGTIYSLDSNGVLTSLFSFNGTNGLNPMSLIFGNDGNLYGTASFGGAFSNDAGTQYMGDGTAFEITTNGAFTLLASFAGTNGAWPWTLIQANDGNFYGVTEYGGAYDQGTVFQMTSNGNVTTLFSFSGTNGSAPRSLIQGSDGALYGTTFSGGISSIYSANGDGTVFRITTNGCFTNLGLFDVTTTGANPFGKLLEVSNGVFYGVTHSGGPGGADGTFFQVTTNGQLTVLVPFYISDPLPDLLVGGLIEASDGNYYGAGGGDFPSEDGLYAIRPIQPPLLQANLQGNQINVSWNAWAGYRYTLGYRTNLTDQNWDGLPLLQTIAPTNGPMSFSDTIGPDSQRFYQLTLDQVR